MLKFRDIINSDLDSFFNQDEFADIHSIDGREIPVIIEEGDVIDRPIRPFQLYQVSDGVFVTDITIYVKSKDYERPMVDQVIVLDEKRYYVKTVNESDGILKIILSANEA